MNRMDTRSITRAKKFHRPKDAQLSSQSNSIISSRKVKIDSSRNKFMAPDSLEIHTPFIEHFTLKTLRKTLKYSFRSISILFVVLFSSITWYSILITFNLCYLSFNYFYNHNYTIRLTSLFGIFMSSNDISANDINDTLTRTVNNANSHHSLSITLFECWFLVEFSFMILMNLKYKFFRKVSASHLPKVTREEFVDLLHEFSIIKDTTAWIEGWFFQKPWNEIYLEDFEEWCACLFFNSSPDELTMDQIEMMRELCDTIQSNLPGKLKKRANKSEKNRKILLTLDEPKILHRPLVLYLGIRLLDHCCRVVLGFLAYKRIQDKELPFYMRRGTSKEPAIVFFHGLGVGLSSYVLFAAGLAFNYPDRTILLFEMPSIQMKLDDNHVLPREFSAHVAETLISLGFLKNIVAGHSLGTACVAWMLRFHPQLVKGTIFVDPICFKLWHHHIAYNALYRTPKGFHESFINIVAMSEADHALYLHRYFVWFQNSILTKDLPENSIIFLSEKDNIVATDLVVEYLLENASPSRKIVLYKAFRHGQILASPEFTRVVQSFSKL